MKLAIFLLACVALPAQITIKLTPDTQTQTAAIGKSHGLQYWVLTMGNGGPAPRLLFREQIILAAPVNLIPIGDAQSILAAKIARTFWGNVLHYGTIGAETAAIGLSIARGFTPVNPNVILGISIGASAVAGAQQLAQQNLPSAAALLNQLTFPITLGAAGSATAFATDHEFSTGWVKGQQAVLVTIP